LPQENQQIAEDFLAKHPNFEVLPAAEALKPLFQKDKMPIGCSPDNPWWQLWPHIHGTDGFFGAVFQKKAAAPVAKVDQEDGKDQVKAIQVKTKKAGKELK
jgi:16S rRNA (cytosine967-C5)-methyltransferase